MKPGVLSTLIVLLLVAGLAPARAQRVQMEPCKVLRRDGAAILQQCGRELRSFALTMDGTERTAVQEHSNKFRFSCRPGFCQGEPNVTGWFVDPKGWAQSKQDESTIFDIVAAEAGWKLLGSEQHFRGVFKPSCELSRVTLAGMPGQMICYKVEATDAAGSSTVVMVVADADVGLMVTFQGSDPKDVLDFAISSLRVFGAERGRGDAGLFERWFR
ncbi:MAG: hypothetical protein QOJ15_4252 [Bradyrhizobium sp.]|jgi:hypothetical protein|nr:hypothetical protein [Bradyrhizobium sp.]